MPAEINALCKVGYYPPAKVRPHILRPRLGLAGTEDFDTRIVPLISMSDRQPYYYGVERVYQVQDGDLAPVGDWLPPLYLKEFK